MQDKENDMFGKSKGEPADQDRDAESSAAKAGGPVQQPAVTQGPPETITSIGSGMTIVGKIVGDGVVKIFGRVEGELRASSIHIGDGAQVEGNVVAQELTISGRVKGTIHATRVKLHGTAAVEGDIFHQSLSIDENALFEGSSRREDNPADKPSNVQVNGPNPQAQPQVALIDGNGKLRDKFGSGELIQPAD
jgi:cytoskeletal protein CcmA (bactofilin family)